MPSQAVAERKKRGRKPAERASTLVRVYTDFARQLTRASIERELTVAAFCERYFLPALERTHREYITAEARRIGGGDD
jgi:hypothetical protein